MPLLRVAPLSLALLLAACAAPPEHDGRIAAPEGAATGTCWGRHISSPAVVETITDREILPETTENRPAKVRSVTRQRIVTERHEEVFEVPCKSALTEEVVMTLQRALEVRGHYAGPINGRLTAETGKAIKAYQTTRGLPSDVLSLDAARALGVIAVARDAD